MPRRPFLAGNWKLNLGPAEAARVARALSERVADRGDVDVAIYPTALSIPAVVPVLRGSGIAVGVQDVHTQVRGAFTGANSAEMAREVGCTRALVGHSERRHVFGETDNDTREKVAACLAAGVLPTLCVGETLDERDADRVDEVVHRQLGAALQGLSPDRVSMLTLAYEPVWAIGTGRVATPDQAQAVHASIRGWLRAHFPGWVADEMRIQYGGSVSPGNAAGLMACPDIDGALVGGASLDAEKFAAIIAAAT